MTESTEGQSTAATDGADQPNDEPAYSNPAQVTFRDRLSFIRSFSSQPDLAADDKPTATADKEPDSQETSKSNGKALKRRNAIRKRSEDKPPAVMHRSSSSPNLLKENNQSHDTGDTESPLPATAPTHSTPKRPHTQPRPTTAPIRESPLATNSYAQKQRHSWNESGFGMLDEIELDPRHYSLHSHSEEEGENNEEIKRNCVSLNPAQSLPCVGSPCLVPLKRVTSLPVATSGIDEDYDNSSVGGYATDEEGTCSGLDEEETLKETFISSFDSSTRLHNQALMNELFVKFKYLRPSSKTDRGAAEPRRRSATTSSLERAMDAVLMRSSAWDRIEERSESEEEKPTSKKPEKVNEINDSEISTIKKRKGKPKKLSSPHYRRKGSSPYQTRSSRALSAAEIDLKQQWGSRTPEQMRRNKVRRETYASPLGQNNHQATAAAVMPRGSPRLRPKIKKLKLHEPKTQEKLRKHLQSGKYDQVERDKKGDLALHAIIRSERPDKFKYLLIFMAHSDFGTENIDLPAAGGNTALHLAVQKVDIQAVELLLVFGANIDALNDQRKTPLDSLTNKGVDKKFQEIITLLKSLDAKHGKEVIPIERSKHHTTRLMSISVDRPELQERIVQSRSATADFTSDGIEKPRPLNEALSSSVIAQKLEDNLNDLYAEYDLIDNVDIQLAIGLQQFELHGWRKTSSSAMKFNFQGGSRILILDGGGIRGLIQIEVMSLIEQRTGRAITELFDWIVGTSTGAIVALGLVYGKKTLAEMRQVYFKLKEDVFTQGFGALGYNTDALENILKEVAGTTMKMSDVKEPKVLLSAVYKRTTNLQLNFFNNCFDDEFSNELVWKVARYTSAAPGYFTECDDYVDGGVLANNPSDYGLTAIQNFHRQQGRKLDIACVVSIGTGIFPPTDLGSTSAHENIFSVHSLKKRAANLLTLLTKALSESEDVATNCKSRCEEQHIPFFRFCPKLDTEVAPGETDDTCLINMIMTTKRQALEDWSQKMDDLTHIFSCIEDYSHRETLQILRDRRRLRSQISREKIPEET